MVGARIYIEGGGDAKDLHARCRQAFASLLRKMGFEGRMPRLVACGGRGQTYKDFCTAMSDRRDEAWVAMWVDSEEPMQDNEAAWEHLSSVDRWIRPTGAAEDDVLLMVTCMETWIVADRQSLSKRYGADLRESALPPLDGLESRSRQEVQDALERATTGHQHAYRKGRRAFTLLAEINPDTVQAHCTSLARCRRILDGRL